MARDRPERHKKKITKKLLKNVIFTKLCKILESVLTQILQACQIVKDNYKNAIKRRTIVLLHFTR